MRAAAEVLQAAGVCTLTRSGTSVRRAPLPPEALQGVPQPTIDKAADVDLVLLLPAGDELPRLERLPELGDRVDYLHVFSEVPLGSAAVP